MLCKNCGRSDEVHSGVLMECPGQPLNFTTHFESKYEAGAWEGGKNSSAGSISPISPIVTNNPKFSTALTMMRDVHDKKSADYASSGNRYSNFEQAAATAGITVDQVFATLIGVKMARLAELIGSGKQPTNESVLDSKLDLANYAALWLSYGLGPKP